MYRILLVEDDAALADAITKVLTAWGHEVQKVRDFRSNRRKSGHPGKFVKFQTAENRQN